MSLLKRIQDARGPLINFEKHHALGGPFTPYNIQLSRHRFGHPSLVRRDAELEIRVKRFWLYAHSNNEGRSHNFHFEVALGRHRIEVGFS